MKRNSGARSVERKKHWGDQDGYVAILFAVVLVILLAFIGLAVDVGQAYDTKTHYRIVADAASVAGAKTLNTDTTPDVIWTEVQRMISLNDLTPSDFSFDCGVWNGTSYISKTDPVTLEKLCDIDEGVNAVRVEGSTRVETMYARLAGTMSFLPGAASTSSAPSYNCMQPFGIEGSYLYPPSDYGPGSIFRVGADTGNWGKVIENNGRAWQNAMLDEVCRQDIDIGADIDNISGNDQVKQTFDDLFDRKLLTGTMVFPVVTDFPNGRSDGGQVEVLHFIEVAFAAAPTGNGSNFTIDFRVVNNPVSAPQRIQLGKAILVE